MSRTYRKRIVSFETYYWETFLCKNPIIEKWSDKEAKKEKATYYGNTEKHYTFGLPKCYRKSVNKTRRARDRQAMHDLLRNENEDAAFDPWNCKTSNDWGYW